MYTLLEGKSWSSPVSQWPPVRILKWLNTSRWFMLSELPTMKKKIFDGSNPKSKESSHCPNSKVIPVTVCVLNWCSQVLVPVHFLHSLWEYQLRHFFQWLYFINREKCFFCSWILLLCVRDENGSIGQSECAHVWRQKDNFQESAASFHCGSQGSNQILRLMKQIPLHLKCDLHCLFVSKCFLCSKKNTLCLYVCFSSSKA